MPIPAVKANRTKKEMVWERTRRNVTLFYHKLPSGTGASLELDQRRIHHETVKALLERYPNWRYPEFQRIIQGR